MQFLDVVFVMETCKLAACNLVLRVSLLSPKHFETGRETTKKVVPLVKCVENAQEASWAWSSPKHFPCII